MVLKKNGSNYENKVRNTNIRKCGTDLLLQVFLQLLIFLFSHPSSTLCCCLRDCHHNSGLLLLVNHHYMWLVATLVLLVVIDSCLYGSGT